MYFEYDAHNFILFDILDESDRNPYDCWQSIDMVWLNVPTPFKKGDIVLHKNQKVIISVMRNEDSEYVKDKEVGNGDSSDKVNFCLYTPEALQLAGVNPRKSFKSASSACSFN